MIPHHSSNLPVCLSRAKYRAKRYPSAVTLREIASLNPEVSDKRSSNAGYTRYDRRAANFAGMRAAGLFVIQQCFMAV